MAEMELKKVESEEVTSPSSESERTSSEPALTSPTPIEAVKDVAQENIEADDNAEEKGHAPKALLVLVESENDKETETGEEGEEELNKVESGEVAAPSLDTEMTSSEPVTLTPLTPASIETVKDVVQEKSVVGHAEEKVDDPKALAVVEKVPDTEEKSSGGSFNGDLRRVKTEKKLSLIKAWEDNEKAKADSRAQRTLGAIKLREDTKIADVEAQMKQIEVKLEKQKADAAEELKKKIALISKDTEGRRAMVESLRGKDFFEAEQRAAEYRAKNTVPKKLLGCFGY
ncbi:hypothetical protein IFM89_006668 [Coptis chinensis]|uniref:Remorin n=1 Tax=Coptis chinensis TaxID=261450 RepID=A0A835ITQ2_9MAGN|nr:hypothetical protein IFM89_006668 [Coptis chinensis]